MHRFSRGFTLIELLIVIGILAVLATTAVIVLNPTEFMKKSRDATRLSDLATINKAISLYQTDGGNSYGSSTAIYVSIPDSSSSCANLGLPSLPAGYGYICADVDNYQKADGDGWVPIDFTSVSYGTVLNTLPIDPTNTVATGQYYTYTPGGSWKLAALMESEKYSANMNSDGGPDLGLYELGSNLSLKPFQRGLVGYWKFDEGSGTTATDSSGNGNDGTLTNGPTWTTGQINGSVNFDGVDDYMALNSYDLEANNFAIGTWIKLNTSSKGGILARATGNARRWLFYYDGARFRFKAWNLEYSSYNGPSSINTYTTSYNQWYQVFIVRNGTVISMYIDGNLDNTVGIAVDYEFLTSHDMRIGAAWDFSEEGIHYINGAIDDVRIYNRALSASEIKAIYDATK